MVEGAQMVFFVGLIKLVTRTRVGAKLMFAFIIYNHLAPAPLSFFTLGVNISLRHLINFDVSCALHGLALHCRKEENMSFRTAHSGVRKREFSDCRAGQCAGPASGAGS